MYFFWICPTHKSFKWFIEVLRDMEKTDKYQVLDVHVIGLTGIGVLREDSDATQTACPLEMHKIKVAHCDAKFDQTEIPFERARHDERTGRLFNSPREQVGVLYADGLLYDCR